MNFIDLQLRPIITLDKSHNIYLVALSISILIAIISLVTTINISERIQASTVCLENSPWVILIALSMGMRGLAANFIIFLAIQLLVPVIHTPG